MEIRVLGPLAMDVGGHSIVSNAPKPRQVLALLSVYANQVLPVPQLMEELWGDNLPRSAVTTLQTYILQLRRALAAALAHTDLSAKDVLVTRHGGYLLRVAPDSVDVNRYERLAAAGKAAIAAGDDEAASRLLGQALSLWRGPALVDVRTGRLLDIDVMRLEESRLGVLERRIETDLRLGRHNELLTELTTLTAQHPLHEGLHGHRMVALYRCGRRGHALEVYSTLRSRFVDELGLEPSPSLRRLHHGLLAGDPALDQHTALAAM